ncbi:MAG TPA: porin family protein [Chryseosolibacter sp.]|nr:porin family protein [Chryseosolibacter sp.]
MKTKFSLLALLCFATTLAFSQAEFAIGLKAGPNFASINTDASAADNYKSRTGFHGGAFALIKITKIGIQPEVIFSQQGSKVEIDNENYENNFSYLNIPIMLKLYLAAGINLQLGPQFGFVTKATGPVYNSVTQEWSEEDVKETLKGSDISAGLGAGWDLPFGLTIDARYNLGLSRMNDKDQPDEAKNQVFQLSLGYKLFKLGK